jgi:hypothetical protein
MISYRHRRLAGPPAGESELVSNTPKPTRRLTRRIAIGAAALASLGTAFTLRTTGADAASFAVYKRVTTSSVDLPSTGGTPVVLRSVSVPAGNWLVWAKANPVHFGNADYVRCQIMVGGRQQDAGATLLGNAAPGPTGETGPSVATIALQTAVRTNVTRTFTLQCLHDFSQPSGYIDPGASLIVAAAPGAIG